MEAIQSPSPELSIVNALTSLLQYLHRSMVSVCPPAGHDSLRPSPAEGRLLILL